MTNNSLSEEEHAQMAYEAACQKAHENITSEIGERVKRTITFRQAALLIGVCWVMFLVVGRWDSGDWYWNHAAIREALEDKCETLLSENIVLKSKVSNHEWLWFSHNELNAILEDDPKHMTIELFRFFLEKASTARVEGFYQVINDGNHPRLKKWVEDNMSEVKGLLTKY